jgi:hypothetical protein
MFTRRFVVPFERTEVKDTSVFTATFDVPHNYIDYCGFSFTNDQGLKVLGGILSKITFSEGIPETNGHMLQLRCGLLGLRPGFDRAHNRTHVPLFYNLHLSTPTTYTVTFFVKQLSAEELKTVGVKKNEDLFDKPELFVATSVDGRTMEYTPQTQISPVTVEKRTVPYLLMEETKDLTLLLNVPTLPSRASQLWFRYDIPHISTTSSLFSKLELYHGTKVVHTYSSPVQLQVIDREMHKLFGTTEAERKAQLLYHTITFGAIDKIDLAQCRLVFTLHPQFFKDYTNWVNEDKNKLREIKDAMIIFQFGFVL